MKIVIDYNGKSYESNEIDTTPNEMAEQIYKSLSSMSVLKMDLPNGEVLILGEKALQSAVILFINT